MTCRRYGLNVGQTIVFGRLSRVRVLMNNGAEARRLWGGLQPADPLSSGSSRLKGGGSQDWLAHVSSL
jgi:hypothetical protein